MNLFTRKEVMYQCQARMWEATTNSPSGLTWGAAFSKECVPIMFYRMSFMTVKQGPNLFHLWHKTFQFPSVLILSASWETCSLSFSCTLYPLSIVTFFIIFSEKCESNNYQSVPLLLKDLAVRAYNFLGRISVCPNPWPQSFILSVTFIPAF